GAHIVGVEMHRVEPRRELLGKRGFAGTWQAHDQDFLRHATLYDGFMMDVALLQPGRGVHYAKTAVKSMLPRHLAWYDYSSNPVQRRALPGNLAVLSLP